MKIIAFCTCVYLFLRVQRTNCGCWDPFLKKIGQWKPELLEDEDIDLNNFEKSNLIYYKYAMILFFRVLDLKLFQGNRPIIKKLKHLECFQYEYPSEKKWPSRFDSLTKSCIQVLEEYDQYLPNKDDYLVKALYYRALKWLEIQTDQANTHKGDNSQLKATIKKIIEKKEKARNYVDELFPNISEKDREKFFQDLTSHNNLLRLNGWKKYVSKYDQVFESFLELKNSSGSKKENDHKWLKCDDVEPYEHILQNADPKLFQKIFGKHPLDTMILVDEAMKHYPPKVHYPIFMGIPAKQIDLKNMLSNGEQMKYYKHATLLFMHAFDRKFQHKFNACFSLLRRTEIGQNLRRYPTRYYPYNKIRFCTFQKRMCELAENIYERLDVILEGLDPYTERPYFHRLMKWYKMVLEKEDTTCTDLIAHIDKFLASWHADDAFTKLAKINEKNSILNVNLDRINTIQDVLNLGQNDDDVLYILKYPDTPIFDRQTKHLRCTDIHVYETLIDKMDEEKFKKEFGKDRNEKLDEIRKKLADQQRPYASGIIEYSWQIMTASVKAILKIAGQIPAYFYHNDESGEIDMNQTKADIDMNVKSV